MNHFFQSILPIDYCNSELTLWDHTRSGASRGLLELNVAKFGYVYSIPTN